MTKVIAGCEHTQERMAEWNKDGACPICLTAILGTAAAERDAAQKACAEMRELLKQVEPDWNLYCGSLEWKLKYKSALSTDCGSDYINKKEFLEPVIEFLRITPLNPLNEWFKQRDELLTRLESLMKGQNDH
jgi:hypothetical protein